MQFLSTDKTNQEKRPGSEKKARDVFFQAKLSINSPGDSYEHEADAMADKVMRMKSPQKVGGFFKPVSVGIQRKCAEGCEEEEKQIRRKKSTDSTMQGSSELNNYVSTLSSSGQPLPESARQFFGPRFGQDFSDVKIHTDSIAAKSAESINALAYTTGNNIIFNQGQYSPSSESGQKLMAHELTHVVQQSGENKSIQKAPKNANPGCNMVSAIPSGERYNFIVNTDNFTPGEEARLRSRLTTIAGTVSIDVLGMASSEGPEANNETLSCKRAHKVAEIVRSTGHTVGLETATGGYPGSAHDSNYRAVALNYTGQTPAQPEQPKVCDPHPPVPARGTVPEPRNPHIPSGSLCRGACGPDCPSTCTPLPNVTICLPDSTGTCHYTYTYTNVISCGSHQGCRDHDDCYDLCAVHGHNSLSDSCHIDCNEVCRHTYDSLTCTRWAMGYGPNDRRIQYSDPPTISSSIPGPCPP